ncbi:MAG: sigma-70 family RNA polymerase sigma factor [Oscillospiraceae bacterium]|nr:sigma-70 family RNA polymerase sigma factor [Oscillospiraceae bacterium]
MKMNKAERLSAEELVSRYSKTVYRIALSRLGNPAEAEDITQNVLIKYINADKTFDDEDHRRKWIIRVTVNEINTLVRSAHKRYTTELDEMENVACAPPDSSDETADIREAVARLPEKYRVPVHLFYYEDLSVKDIAAAMSVSEGTVKSLLSRARAKLREMLEEQDYVG